MGIKGRISVKSKQKVVIMKLIVASLVGFLNAESLGRERYSRDAEYEDASLEFATSNDERKMKQLEVQLAHYNGGAFDMASIRGYGCNCFMNDFGIENISYGKPVNNFDSSCRAYQECLKCAKEEHGDQCFPDFTGYILEVGSDGEISCDNNRRTCRRSLCECDKMFAKMQAEHAAEYDHQYNVLSGWEPQDSCIRGGSPLRSQPACCGGSGNPFIVYNTLVKQCCADGKVALHGQCPGDDDEEELTTTPPPNTPGTTPTPTMPGVYGKK